MSDVLMATPAAVATDLPSLPALLHPWVEQLISGHGGLIRELTDGFAAPVHLVFPHLFTENVAAFQRVITESGVDGQILYAKKANKARCFVEQCAATGIGVDAASVAEAEQALGAGVPGERIGISGPAKDDRLLRLALYQRSLIAVDALDELRRIAELATAMQVRGRILIRCLPDQQPNSRFGMREADLDEAFRLCAAHAGSVELEGFSFHLSGYSPVARAEMAARMVNRCLDARSLGFAARVVDIGGGFAMSYTRQADWQRFLSQQRPAHYHAGKAFDDFYPYHGEVTGAAMLAEILAWKTAGGGSLGGLLRQHRIRLLLEPGRALLDQAGISVFQVQGVKDRGYGIVTVNGTSFSLSEQWFNSEFLPDPLLLGGARPSAPYAACVGGVSCLDSDMLTWRKVRFPHKPRAGDLLLYLNTAGYQMDSNESPFHDLPLPPKVVLTPDVPKPRWRLDRAL